MWRPLSSVNGDYTVDQVIKMSCVLNPELILNPQSTADTEKINV